MKNSYFYSLAAIILAARVGPKPICAIGVVVFVALSIFADSHGA